jgi:DNA invertase Pin-like site-specific DNA recombinase
MLPRTNRDGYRLDVVKEFQDEGISGDGMKKRDAFKEMLAFCEAQARQGTPVQAIVCFDTSRFSRATSIETNHYIWLFQQAGVHRVFTYEKVIDFRKEEDRAVFNLTQDFSNHRFLKDISQRLLRGKKAVAAAGYYTGGALPYGFDRVLVDEKNQEQGRFRRGEKVRLRNQGWREVLAPIPEDDPDPVRQQERATVLWLFDTFARRHVSYRWLAEQLNTRTPSVPGPGSRYHRRKPADLAAKPDPTKWTVRSVAGILSNPVYKGLFRFGVAGRGKFNRLVNGEITAVEPGAARTTNSAGLIEMPLERGGYVTPELWDAVQAKAKERARLKLKPRTGGYTLPSGILYCGHCKHRMYGCTMRPKRGDKVYEYRKYICSAPNVKPGVCKPYAIAEDEVVKVMVVRLQKVYLNPERLAGLEAELLWRAEGRHDTAPADAKRLQQRLAKLEETIVRNRRRVLQADDDSTFAELNEGLKELVEERQRLEKELAEVQARQAAPAEQGAAKIRAAIARLRKLGEQLHKAKGQQLGEVLRLLVSRADLYFQEQTKGKKRWYAFVKGVVKVRPVLDVKCFERFDK